MRFFYILFIVLIIITSCKSTENYKIKGKLKSCHDLIQTFDNEIYLLSDGQIIDSANTAYRSFLSFPIYKKRFAFKNLNAGEYKLKYNPRFRFDSTKTVTILDKSVKVDICLAEIPQTVFKEMTLIDKLNDIDTLFINVYIASAGEFGGYDEGLWIWKDHERIKCQFYDLSSTYGMDWDSDRITFYKQNKSKAKPKSEIIDIKNNEKYAIKTFLIETRNYNEKQPWASNAPEFITVYDRTNKYQIEYHDFNWKPYEKLKKSIITAGNSGE
jgi:hypothetical protein